MSKTSQDQQQQRHATTQADTASVNQRFEKFVAPLLATGDHSPETRKRKAQEILIATSKKARADLKDYKFSKVELEDVVQDLDDANRNNDTTKLEEIQACQTDTKVKRRKYREALNNQYEAADKVHSLVANLFPELRSQVPQLTELRQGVVGGVKRREFNVYEPLEPLKGRCYLTSIDDAKVVLKGFPLIGELNRFDKELSVLSRIQHEVCLH